MSFLIFRHFYLQLLPQQVRSNMYLLSDFEVKLTCSESPVKSLNSSIVICVFSVIHQLLLSRCCAFGQCFFYCIMFCNCNRLGDHLEKYHGIHTNYYYYYYYCMERRTECLPHDERHQEQTSTVTATYRPVGHPLHPLASALAALTTYHHATPDDRHAYGKDESDRQTETEPRENPPQLKTAEITVSDIVTTVLGGCGIDTYGFRVTGRPSIPIHTSNA